MPEAGIQMRDARIYKIATAAEWRDAERAGGFAGSADDRRDGFIHCSTAAQLPETAARHFAGGTGLVLAAIDPAGLDVRWEPSRGGALFPHVYGELPLSAVRWCRPLPLGADGRHVFAALDDV